MHRNAKQQRGPRPANFFVAAALLIVCNIALGFVTSWHLAALIIPPLVSLITIVLLLLMRARQQIDRCDSSLLEKCCQDLHDKFEIQHATIQFATEDHDCGLAPDNKV